MAANQRRLPMRSQCRVRNQPVRLSPRTGYDQPGRFNRIRGRDLECRGETLGKIGKGPTSDCCRIAERRVASVRRIAPTKDRYPIISPPDQSAARLPRCAQAEGFAGKLEQKRRLSRSGPWDSAGLAAILCIGVHSQVDLDLPASNIYPLRRVVILGSLCIFGRAFQVPAPPGWKVFLREPGDLHGANRRRDDQQPSTLLHVPPMPQSQIRSGYTH